MDLDKFAHLDLDERRPTHRRGPDVERDQTVAPIGEPIDPGVADSAPPSIAVVLFHSDRSA
jgi:hypothetical protein